jgi:drug/metabolite transporter (DMT)-like permease
MKSSLVMVLLAGVLFGTIPVFTTPLSSSGVDAEVQVAWRLIVGAPVLILPALLVERREFKEVRPSDLLVFVGIGGVLLGLFLAYIGSLSIGTPAATAVLLLYSQPIFSVLLSRLLLHEKIARARSVALFLGIGGVLLVVNPLGLERGSGPGLALALSSGFLYAVYIVASGEMAKTNRFQSVTITSLSFGGALLLLLPVGLLIQSFISHSAFSAGIVTLSTAQVGLLLGLVAFGTVLPYLALNRGLKNMRASDAGITLLVEPVSVFALGYIFLGQVPGPNEYVGGVLIGISIFVLYRYGEK